MPVQPIQTFNHSLAQHFDTRRSWEILRSTRISVGAYYAQASTMYSIPYKCEYISLELARETGIIYALKYLAPLYNFVADFVEALSMLQYPNKTNRRSENLKIIWYKVPD